MENSIYVLDKLFETLNTGQYLRRKEAEGLKMALHEMAIPLNKEEKKLTISNFDEEKLHSDLRFDFVDAITSSLNQKILVQDFQPLNDYNKMITKIKDSIVPASKYSMKLGEFVKSQRRQANRSEFNITLFKKITEHKKTIKSRTLSPKVGKESLVFDQLLVKTLPNMKDEDNDSPSKG